MFHIFDVVSESFLFLKIRAISWKIYVKTCGDILMIKIVSAKWHPVCDGIVEGILNATMG